MPCRSMSANSSFRRADRRRYCVATLYLCLVAHLAQIRFGSVARGDIGVGQFVSEVVREVEPAALRYFSTLDMACRQSANKSRISWGILASGGCLGGYAAELRSASCCDGQRLWRSIAGIARRYDSGRHSRWRLAGRSPRRARGARGCATRRLRGSCAAGRYMRCPRRTSLYMNG